MNCSYCSTIRVGEKTHCPSCGGPYQYQDREEKFALNTYLNMVEEGLRRQEIRKGLKHGIFTVNEIRERVDLSPIPYGDTLFLRTPLGAVRIT